MFIDANQLASLTTLHTDVCVLGAGAAGIALSRALPSREVLLVESGEFHLEPKVQALNNGEMYLGKSERFDSYLTRSRLRYFGGTTNHWEGYCRPLDALDFETRPWIASSGWPIRMRELNAYYEKALSEVEISPFSDDGPSREKPEIFQRFVQRREISVRTLQRSPPTRFGERYRDEIVSSKRITLLCHGNALKLKMHPNGLAIGTAEIGAFPSLKRVSISANVFVVALGAIENARLLLNSQIGTPQAGKGDGLVGRYFMEHLLCENAGWAAFSFDPLKGGGTRYQRLSNPRPVLGPGPQLQEQKKWLNIRMHLDQAQLSSPERGEIAQFYSQSRLSTGPYVQALGLLIETPPIESNRVVLSPHHDAFGEPLASVYRTAHPKEDQTLQEFLAFFGEELGRFRLGRLKILRRDMTVRLAYHSMGTTRMAESPSLGVVDANCRVFGVENLFAAGSSVFPTGGAQNPTLTLIALALRLADHLSPRRK